MTNVDGSKVCADNRFPLSSNDELVMTFVEYAELRSFFSLYTSESACYMHTPYRATCHMSTPNLYRTCLNELAAATPRKKAALIRSLLPSIEAALGSGQTLKDIWTALENKGLGMAYRVFQMTVWRARRSKKTTAPRDWEKVDVSSPQEPLQQSEPLNVEGRDPLENLKRLEENRPGFHWRGTNSQRTVMNRREAVNDKGKR